MDKKALLDALCDQIVTALGVGYMMGFDMEGALAEVNRSNYTKFTTDEQGIQYRLSMRTVRLKEPRYLSQT